MVSDSWGVAPSEERVGGFLEGASGIGKEKILSSEDTALDVRNHSPSSPSATLQL